jgi:hypothetical protein
MTRRDPVTPAIREAVLRFTPEMVKSGVALATIERALA